jgi:hypothetical protein
MVSGPLLWQGSSFAGEERNRQARHVRFVSPGISILDLSIRVEYTLVRHI